MLPLAARRGPMSEDTRLEISCFWKCCYCLSLVKADVHGCACRTQIWEIKPIFQSFKDYYSNNFFVSNEIRAMAPVHLWAIILQRLHKLVSKGTCIITSNQSEYCKALLHLLDHRHMIVTASKEIIWSVRGGIKKNVFFVEKIRNSEPPSPSPLPAVWMPQFFSDKESLEWARSPRSFWQKFLNFLW